MTIPFLDVLKKATAFFRSSAAVKTKTAEPEQRVLPVEKPSSERLSKTVMPNRMRVTGSSYSSGGAAVPNTRLSESRGNGKRDLPPAVALALQAQTERAITLHLSELVDQVPQGFLKPAGTFDTTRQIVLKASEIEKGMSAAKPTVSLAAIYEQVPEIFLQSLPPDDLTQVALPYQRVLEQFSSVKVREDQEKDADIPQVETPFLKVAVEDTKRFGTPMASPQSSTQPPVKVEPATAKTISSAVPEAFPRETAAAPGKQQRVQLKPGVVALTSQGTPSSAPAPATSTPPAAQPQSGAPTRIPFHLPPNGTGGSASERVPASGGPSVPTTPPPSSSASPTVPARIPFKLATSSPGDPTKPKLTLVPGVQPPEKTPDEPAPVAPAKMAVTPPPPAAKPATIPAPAIPASAIKSEVPPMPNKLPSVPPAAKAEPAAAPIKMEIPPAPSKPVTPIKVEVPPAAAKAEPAAAPAPQSGGEPMIALSVRAVLLNVPVFQFTGDAESIPADVRMELPLAMVQSQLMCGKVAVPPKIFQAALPDAYRAKFACDDIDTPVLLPLQEVLKNLPASALKMRDDQEKPQLLPQIETPFSIKAAEDAAKKLTTPPVTATPVKTEKPSSPPSTPQATTVKVEAPVSQPATTKAAAPAPEISTPKPATPVQPAAAPKEPVAFKDLVAANVEKLAQEASATSPAAKPPLDLKQPVAAKEVVAAKPELAPAPVKPADQPKKIEPVTEVKTPILKLPPLVPPTAAQKAEAKAEPKIEPKPEAKVEPKPEPKVEPKPEAKVEPKPEAKVELKPEPKVELKLEAKPEPKIPVLQRPAVPAAPAAPAPPAIKVEAKSNAKEVVEKAKSLTGVAGCSVTFADGLSLAGNMPNEVALDGLCAVAPPLLKKIDRHMVDSRLGSLTSMTLHSEKSPVTFFMKGNVCLTVLHAGGELTNDTQEKLWEMAKELSRFYSEPETAHVDH